MEILQKNILEELECNRLASYALTSKHSKGREIPEANNELLRTEFQRDRNRILHSKAFRRLGGKTQVLSPSVPGDHFRDRLTHTLEVAQISRSIARNLNLNEDAAEAIALAHDLGHTPYGHAGEMALNECLKKHGRSFEHNEQSLHVVRHIEKLNLSLEILEGLQKHKTPFDQVGKKFVGASLEAQIVNLADEIAYLNHDIDDGLRLGALTLVDLERLPIWDGSISSLMRRMLISLLQQTIKNIEDRGIINLTDVYLQQDFTLVEFPADIRSQVNELRHLLYEKFYLGPKVSKANEHGQHIIKKLFNFYLENPDHLPQNYQDPDVLTSIKDYIAGMTDQFAEQAILD